MMAAKEIAVCHVFREGNLLLLKFPEGLSKDKWNAPSGEVLEGEAPAKSAIRYLYQQTGLYTNKATYHGTVNLYLNGQNELSYKLHIYSTKSATGDLKPTVGEAKWFGLNNVPYYEMFPDDRYWLSFVMQGKQFDASFYFDEKNEKVLKYQITERQNVVGKIAPIIIILAIIGVIAYAVVSTNVLSGISSGLSHVSLPKFTSTTKNTLFSPSVSSIATTTSVTTISTTSIPPVPTPTRIVINNIDVLYKYSGPAYYGSTNCNEATKSVVIYFNRILNRTTFLMNATIYSSGCNLTVTNIGITTPGFTISSIEPSLSQTIPPQSSMFFELLVSAQNRSYVGPLAVTINEQ